MILKYAIKKYCFENDTNVLELSRLLRIKAPTLYFILRGHENITIETAERLSRVGIVPRFKAGKVNWVIEK